MHILSLSGFVPEQICDTIRFFGYEGRQRISHYCQYAADFSSRVMEDPGIDGAVFPRTCDSSRVLGNYIEGRGRKFLYQLPIPARKDRLAAACLTESIRQYKHAVEQYYGIRLSDILERAERINARNRELAGLYENLPAIQYGAYLDMLHGLLQKPLYDQQVPAELPACPCPDGPRVFIVGSTQTGSGVVRQAEAVGMNIVGDRLPESRRLFCAPPVSLTGDIFENIASSLLEGAPSPTQDGFARILCKDREEIMQKQVQGVIFVTQKYCEPYDYLFPAYQRMLEEAGVKVLRVTVTGCQDGKEAALSLETFADML